MDCQIVDEELLRKLALAENVIFPKTRQESRKMRYERSLNWKHAKKEKSPEPNGFRDRQGS